MDIITDPEKVWIEDRCYRKLPIAGSVRKTLVEEDNYPITANEFAQDNEEDIDIVINHEGYKFWYSIPIPGDLVGFIAGKKCRTKEQIEEETSTKIFLPVRPQLTDMEGRGQNIIKPVDGNIIVEGKSRRSVYNAVSKIQRLADTARMKIAPTHFISIPMISREIQDGYMKFQKDVLSHCKSERGVSPSLFQPVEKLHLTLCMLTLLDARDKEKANEVLLKAKDTIIALRNNKPFKIMMRGVEYMNDDPSEVNIVYGKVHEIDHDNRLQIIADNLSQSFSESGLSMQYEQTVKLHVTLLKSYSERDVRQTFDARKILKRYEDFPFGEMTLSTIHISVRFTSGKDGYYLSNYEINF